MAPPSLHNPLYARLRQYPQLFVNIKHCHLSRDIGLYCVAEIDGPVNVAGVPIVRSTNLLVRLSNNPGLHLLNLPKQLTPHPCYFILFTPW